LQDPLRFGDEVSKDARSILTLLLNRDPSKRLGSGSNGANDIKNHEFFAKHVDWNRLMAKKVQPPFKPAVVSVDELSLCCPPADQLSSPHFSKASAVDTSNFDPEFTNEQPVDSVVDDSHMVRIEKDGGDELEADSPFLLQLSATVQEQFQGFSYNGNENGFDASSYRG
jgi:serum/glucocorticoid-regulated kinase 2